MILDHKINHPTASGGANKFSSPSQIDQDPPLVMLYKVPMIK